MTTQLSKSKIMSGLQCEKRLWLETHRKDKAVVSDDTEQRFSIGHTVGEAACALHPDGHLVEWSSDGATMLAETKRILEEAPDAVLFEATFKHQGVLIRADVLKKGADGYELIEVKASTTVKEQHLPDCAVQAWVLEGCGLPLARVELAHIDNQFTYRGDDDYRGLFQHEDMMESVAAIKREIPQWVRNFKTVLQGDEPNIEMGDHCTKPYDCPFRDYCSAQSGRTLQKEKHGGTGSLNPEVKAILREYLYPRYYLDFETIQFAVPIWKDTRPYQQLTFQWSCHEQSKTGVVTHLEFLDTTGDSPMRPFIESLLRAVGKHGPIFVYHHFEKNRLNELATRFPDLATAIEKVITRLVNLLPITKEYYYHPDLSETATGNKSYSLKSVLPTIAPHLGYENLGEVQDGSAAGVAYQEIINSTTEKQRANTLAADLRAYCKRDTEALIALVQFLESDKVTDNP